MISRQNEVVEDFHYGGLRISSRLFADHVILLASSRGGLQLTLKFAAGCEVVGVRINIFKPEAMDLNRKRVECSFWVWDELLTQAEEYNYLSVLFRSEGERGYC